MSGRVRTARHASGRRFLGSRALAAAIVESAGVRPGELVFDLGAGGGILTAALAQRGAQAVAVELDAELALGLRARFAEAENVEVREADLRALRWPDGPFRVVANLPFSAGTDALRSLLGRRPVGRALPVRLRPPPTVGCRATRTPLTRFSEAGKESE